MQVNTAAIQMLCANTLFTFLLLRKRYLGLNTYCHNQLVKLLCQLFQKEDQLFDEKEN